MTIEEQLKDLIVQRYGSVKGFSAVCGLPYETVYTILKRGVNRASVTNIIAICKTLNISTDELAVGRIVPVIATESSLELEKFLTNIRFEDFTVDGVCLSSREAEMIRDTIESTVMLIRRKR